MDILVRFAAAVGAPRLLDITQAHIDAILDLAKGRPGRRVSLAGGFTAVREREYIRISSPPES